MHSGWIKLHRKIKDNVFWNDKPFSKGQAWVDLLLLANHKDGTIKVKNGEIITIKRGECGYSQKGLADKWGWSRGKVNRFLRFLNERKMVQQKIIENHTVTAILNYDSYQNDTTNSTTNSTTNGHQTVQQTDTNKNDKNDKNEKNIYIGGDVTSLINYYNKQFNSNYSLFINDHKYGNLELNMKKALESYSQEDLFLAIDNFKKDPFFKEKKLHRPILLFKDLSTIDKYLNSKQARSWRDKYEGVK